ncbi:hypothetical protein V2J09_013143 [Rumex salicifolius]
MATTFSSWLSVNSGEHEKEDFDTGCRSIFNSTYYSLRSYLQVRAVVIQAGASRENEILAGIRDVFSFICIMEPRRFKDTMLMSRQDFRRETVEVFVNTSEMLTRGFFFLR